MAKRLPRPNNPIRVRLEWDDGNMRSLDMAAADCGLSVASFARLALEMLTSKGSVAVADVKAEAARLTTQGDETDIPEPEPEKPARKGKK